MKKEIDFEKAANVREMRRFWKVAKTKQLEKGANSQEVRRVQK